MLNVDSYRDVRAALTALSDPDYAAFCAKLAPDVPPERFLGVRIPVLRQFAKDLRKSGAHEDFLRVLPHATYDENLLHSVLLEGGRDFAQTLQAVNAFLPFVDNWAVCDTLRPRVFASHKQELLPRVKDWIASPRTYTCRFGIDMLMTHYADEDFSPAYLQLPAAVTNEAYYVRMMVAWYFATLLAKQWDAALPYLENRCLPVWTHNKTIQKACESFRVTEVQKEYLKGLRIRKEGE